jgi:hypothetical protein
MKSWKRTDWLIITIMTVWIIGVLFIVINYAD